MPLKARPGSHSSPNRLTLAVFCFKLSSTKSPPTMKTGHESQPSGWVRLKSNWIVYLLTLDMPNKSHFNIFLSLFVYEMIVPPQLNTRERKNHDLNDLRVYYMICEDLGIAEKEDIQKSFFHLMRWAGNYKFLEEFQIFKNYIDKLKKDKNYNK